MKKQDLSWAWKEQGTLDKVWKKGKKKKRDRQVKRDFYRSDDWLKLRYRVLRKYGACCMCCGKRGSRENPVHVDHIKPRSRHSHLELVFGNLQILCEDCNLGKGAWDETDWRLPEGAADHMKAL